MLEVVGREEKEQRGDKDGWNINTGFSRPKRGKEFP
jgi:hypothetical protein